MSAQSLLTQLQDWSLTAATRRGDRPWCTFGLDGAPTQEAVAKLFNRDDLVKKYKDRYNDRDPQSKQPHSYLQVEIGLLYGMHKAFVSRHKTRLQCYRDDSSQKAYHTRRAVTKAWKKFEVSRDEADAASTTPTTTTSFS